MAKARKFLSVGVFVVLPVAVVCLLVLIAAPVVLTTIQLPSWLELPIDPRLTISLLVLAHGIADSLLHVLALIGIVIAASFALLALWHYGEMNLARRVEDWQRRAQRAHLEQRPALVERARHGLGSLPADIEISRLAMLRSWFARSDTARARVLAGSAHHYARQVAALNAATVDAQLRQITAHIIRGYALAAKGDDARAMREFNAATAVRRTNLLSRDIAAGCARRLKDSGLERILLGQVRDIAREKCDALSHAIALRRLAELEAKGSDTPSWRTARNHLTEAIQILQPLVGHRDANLELGRALTLYSEMRCNLGRPGRLGGPNQPLSRALALLRAVPMHTRPEEDGGERYGEPRVQAIKARISQPPGDAIDDA